MSPHELTHLVRGEKQAGREAGQGAVECSSSWSWRSSEWREQLKQESWADLRRGAGVRVHLAQFSTSTDAPCTGQQTEV